VATRLEVCAIAANPGRAIFVGRADFSEHVNR